MVEPIDLAAIKRADEKLKPMGAHDTWCALTKYYEDTSRTLTVQNLQRLGLGLRENIHPMEINLLAYVMGRLNVVYSDPASRWLVKGNRRLAESNAQHKLLQKTYESAQMDTAMREAAAKTALLGQSVLRFYAIDSRKAVVPRLFGPQHVLREVDPGSSDQITEDKRFALCLSGDIYEAWERTIDGWRCQRFDKGGRLLPPVEQPFTETGDICPYAVLPVVMLFDRWPGGQAWIPPKTSRVGMIEAINASINDLQNLCAFQGHGQWVYKRDDPNTKLPEQFGPGTAWEIGKDEDLQNITPQTNITSVREVLREYVSLFLSTEGLPADELEKQRQVFSGAQLQVSEKSLTERREAQLPMAAESERQIYSAHSAVHNVHAEEWGLESFDPELGISVEFGDIDTPVDSKDLTETLTNQLAARLISPIDALQRVHSCSRDQAIQIWERIESDFELYPIGKPQMEMPEGTQADPSALDAVNKLNGENSDSMVDASNGVSSADRRELRRNGSLLE